MAKRSFQNYVEQELGKFAHFLIYALLEWVLIFILFVDGFLAFFANEFARFFELKIPCLLCTRIDHVLVRRAADFYYNDSICESHKKDVSYLAYCHNHKKLSHIRKMCDTCLLSFSTEKASSDLHTCKSQAGILQKDIGQLVLDNDIDYHSTFSAVQKDDLAQADKSSQNRCSCCGEPLKVKPYVKGKGSSIATQAPTPSPRAPFVNIRNEERNLDLANIKFTELKFPTNELELHEHEDGTNSARLGNKPKEDVKSANVSLLKESEEIMEDKTPRTPFARGNKFFGIPLTDSANASPRSTANLSPRFAAIASPRFARILRKSPLEKTEIALETYDYTVSNEAEGDIILQHLKGQVKLDNKSLMALYIELDEERSASAIAANNAMAMITRLQAEKAAVQMEALQYQRMMEEQAEYDQEALQASNDLLADREMAIKALEAELEEYRIKYGPLEEEVFLESGDDDDEDFRDKNSQAFSLNERSEFLSTASSTDRRMMGENLRTNNLPSSPEKSHKGLQLNRFHDLGRLKNLNKKLNISSDDGAPSSVSSSDNVTSWPAQDIQLMKELLHLHERVKGLEADDALPKSPSQTNQNDSEKENLLTEICDNLQKLRQFISMPDGDDIDA